MRLSEFGQAVSHYWTRIPAHVAHVELDERVVMPNHVHGIIVIAGRGEASPASASSTGNLTTARLPDDEAAGILRHNEPARDPCATSLSVTTRRINRLRGMPGTPFWQRNYWEHIIRNDASPESDPRVHTEQPGSLGRGSTAPRHRTKRLWSVTRRWYAAVSLPCLRAIAGIRHPFSPSAGRRIHLSSGFQRGTPGDA